MNKNLLRSIRLGLVVLAGMVIYAYGFQVTKVSLSEISETRRQETFFRILRALAHPDIFEYEREEFIVEVPIYMPCPAGELDLPAPDTSGPYMVVTPPCADAKAEVTVEGFNFEPNTSGPLNFIPPSQVTLQLGSIETDAEGHFKTSVTLPNRKPVEEPQLLRAITRRNVGSPMFTKTAKDTWQKIVETVFLALLATTFGTLLAIPISFFAARNLMKDVISPMASIALSVLAWPAGAWIGLQAANWARTLSETINEIAYANVASLVISPVIAWVALRWALPPTDTELPSLGARLARLVAMLVAAFASILALFVLAHLAQDFGQILAKPLGGFGFLGIFMANLGEILGAILTLVIALTLGGTLGNIGGRVGQLISERTPKSLLTSVNVLLGALAGGVLFALLGGVIEWLYQLNNPTLTLWGPAAVGALGAIAIVIRTSDRDAVPIGLMVYYVTRTILNTLRSIEAFIMAIIFVALVSTGPFAGVLALSLHTVAALAKLYSEQVESILPGPLEAIRATGATRLQTIVYAVIPQIIPPYISFTMYRWDINVRMSTIIGFAGGGGIGFLLQQNINLLNYRAASVQMLAITIVVALMDNISSTLRERVV